MKCTGLWFMTHYNYVEKETEREEEKEAYRLEGYKPMPS